MQHKYNEQGVCACCGFDKHKHQWWMKAQQRRLLWGHPNTQFAKQKYVEHGFEILFRTPTCK